MPIIAIASTTHTGGAEIASHLEDRLGGSLVTQELFDSIASTFDLPAEQVRRTLAGERPLLDPLTHQTELTVARVRSALSKLLNRTLILHGTALHLIPRAVTQVLRVGVVGEKSFRVAAASAAEGIAPDKAARRIDRSDALLSAWTLRQIGLRFWDPALFDLILTRPQTTVANAVAHVSEAAAQDAFQPTESSLQAVRDFRLSARVHLALLNQGQHDVDVTAKRGEVVVRCLSRRSPAGVLARTLHAVRQESRLQAVARICRDVYGVGTVRVVPHLQGSKPVELGAAGTHRSTVPDRLWSTPRPSSGSGRDPRPPARTKPTTTYAI